MAASVTTDLGRRVTGPTPSNAWGGGAIATPAGTRFIAERGASAPGHRAGAELLPAPGASFEPPSAEDALATTGCLSPASELDLPSGDGRDTNLCAVLGGAPGDGSGSCSGAPEP